MTEVQFAESQSLQLTYDKPSNTGLITRDSGFQEIDIKMMNGKIGAEAKVLLNKKLSKNEAGLLDPWVNDTKDQEDYESIKFDKSISQKVDSLDDTEESDNKTIDSLIFDPLGDEKIIASNPHLSD